MSLGCDKDGLWSRGGVHLDHLALLVIVVYDGHARLDKGPESLADALGIVVGAAARLSTLEKAFLHDLFGAVEEEDHLGGADRLFKFVRLVKLSGETVDEEAALGSTSLGESFGHGVLEKLDGDFHGDNETVLDIVADQVAKLRTRTFLLGAQQVAGRQMSEVVFLDQVGALSSLAGTGPAEHENDGDVGGGECGRWFSWCWQLAGGLSSFNRARHVFATVHETNVPGGTDCNDSEKGPELDLVLVPR